MSEGKLRSMNYLQLPWHCCLSSKRQVLS